MTSSNGLAVLEFDPSQMPSNAQTFARGDIVRCKAQAVETVSGEASGFHYTLDDDERAAWQASALSNVFNSDPRFTGVSITPPSGATVETELECRAMGWTDLDGDTAQYEFKWYNGSQEFSGQTLTSSVATLTSGFARGDNVKCKVSFWDDYIGLYSDPPNREGRTTYGESNIVMIGNAPPTIGSARLTVSPSGDATESSTLRCDGLDTNDPDSQDFTLAEFRWLVNGSVITSQSQQLQVITGTDFDRGDSVYCQARAVDNYAPPAQSAWVSSSAVVVQNTPPSPPTIAINPVSPTDADGLNCQVTIDSTDVDPADTSFTYTYSWSNGSTTVAGQTLAASNTSAGETWTCTVTPNDGEDNGTPSSASVTIGSSQPATSCSSLSFDGVDDYVEVPYDSSFSFGSSHFTIEAWFKVAAWPSEWF